MNEHLLCVRIPGIGKPDWDTIALLSMSLWSCRRALHFPPTSEIQSSSTQLPMRYVNTLYWSQKPNRRNDTVVGNASEGVLEEVAFELALISAGGVGRRETG